MKTPFSNISIVDFKQVNVSWEVAATENKYLTRLDFPKHTNMHLPTQTHIHTIFDKNAMRRKGLGLGFKVDTWCFVNRKIIQTTYKFRSF